MDYNQYINIGLFILALSLGIFSLYFGTQQLKLYQLGIIKSTKRISLQMIKLALSANKDNEEYFLLLTKIKTLYIVYLIIFYFTMVLVAIQIYRAAT
jgi:hypothetical protein